MQRHRQNGLEWLEFDLLSDIPFLKHAVYLRKGGHSKGSFNSLNTSFYTGDEAEDVKKNQGLIHRHICPNESTPSKLIYGKGCHESTVAKVDLLSPDEIPNCDGIITNVPNTTLLMTHADCQVALIYDPIHKAIGNIHSGWRGSVQNIYQTAINRMKQEFGSNPSDLLVCITPSIGPDAGEFTNYQTELPEEFWAFQPRPTYFDFWSISEWQLQGAGILPHHIEIARLCTYANAHDFYSYRRDKMTGRHGTCIALTKN